MCNPARLDDKQRHLLAVYAARTGGVITGWSALMPFSRATVQSLRDLDLTELVNPQVSASGKVVTCDGTRLTVEGWRVARALLAADAAA